MIVLGTMAAVVVLVVGGCVYLVGHVERTIAGACGRDSPASPRAALNAKEIGDYERRNLALLDGLMATFGPARSVGRRPAYKCPTNMDKGAAVGLTTDVTFTAPDAVDRCTVVRQIEALLTDRGWTVRSLDTSSPDGSAFGGQTDASLGRARLRASVQIDQRLIFVSVDHDNSTGLEAQSATFPTTPCR
jgi:hypothetical protein